MQKFSHLVLFLIISIFSCSNSTKIIKNNKIKLETASIDQYEIDASGIYLRPSDTSGSYYEKINKLPENYTTIETYNICVQNLQNSYYDFCSDTLRRNNYFKDNDESFYDW